MTTILAFFGLCVLGFLLIVAYKIDKHTQGLEELQSQLGDLALEFRRAQIKRSM